MASEIRVNRLSNRSGLSTITFANGGVQFSGITTFANGDFRVGTGATILNPSTNEMQFHTGGSSRLTINNSGANLGTGNITAVDATFTGNVSIGKTLTYEDVKNVDSVGVVTARTGVKVTGGDFTVGTAITASSVTGNVTQDVGITTYSGSAVWFKGATANKDMYWSHASGATVYKDNAQILMGDGSDLQLKHDGTNSIITNNTGDLNVITAANQRFNTTGDFVVNVKGGTEDGLKVKTDGACELYHNNSLKFSTTSSGVDCPDQLQVDGTTFATGGLKVNADNQKIRLGASDDLEIYHDGSHSILKNTTGYLRLLAGGSGVSIGNADNSEAMAYFLKDGSVDLYYNNFNSFQTTSTGVKVLGPDTDGASLELFADRGDDNADKWRILASGAGEFVVANYASGSWENSILANGNGSVELYHNNVKKVETVSDGIKLPDESNVQVGTGSDLTLRHNGSHSYITNTTGQLQIQCNSDDVTITAADDVLIKTQSNHHAIECKGDGPVDIYYDGVKKFSTQADGARITGGTYTSELELYTNDGIQRGQIYVTNGNEALFKAGHGDTYLRYIYNAAVEIYHDNTKKFETSSTGISVSGSVSFSANNTYNVGTNTVKPNAVFSNYWVHRYGQSGNLSWNQSEGIFIQGGFHFFHDYITLSSSNFSHGMAGNRTYNLLRMKNAGSGAAIYAESGAISSGSDYRMKENVSPITGAIDVIKNLKPCTYNIRKSFNEHDGGGTHQGFIAHEVQEAIPNIVNIVNGNKDDMEEVLYMNEDTNIPAGKKPGDGTGVFTGKPDMQGIDYGHMTPILAAALKELIAEVETLKTEVAALKSS